MKINFGPPVSHALPARQAGAIAQAGQSGPTPMRAPMEHRSANGDRITTGSQGPSKLMSGALEMLSAQVHAGRAKG